MKKPQRLKDVKAMQGAKTVKRDFGLLGTTTARTLKNKVKLRNAKGVSTDEVYRVRARERLRQAEERARIRNESRGDERKQRLQEHKQDAAFKKKRGDFL